MLGRKLGSHVQHDGGCRQAFVAPGGPVLDLERQRIASGLVAHDHYVQALRSRLPWPLEVHLRTLGQARVSGSALLCSRPVLETVRTLRGSGPCTGHPQSSMLMVAPATMSAGSWEESSSTRARTLMSTSTGTPAAPFWRCWVAA